jgi:type I restriction enzyme S subunit
VSELPSGWVVTIFDDVISSMTNGLNGTQNKDGIGIPVSRIETISHQFIDFNKIGYISDYDANKIENFKLNENDILFSHINSPIHLGKTAIYNSERELYHGVNLLRISLNEAVEPRLFNYYCKYIRALGVFSSQAQHAVNQSSLNQKKLGKFEIVLPPKNEQIRIADKLDSILAKVNKAQERLEKIPGILKRFRQSVLAAATSGELTREWRESRSNNINHDFLAYAIEDYDSKPLPELPPDWIFIPFEHAADIKSNLVDPKLTPDAVHLAPNHIEQNTGKILEKATVADDGVTSSKHKFFSGQIIYSKIRPYLNKVCLVDFDGVCSADMYPIEAKSNTKYLLYFMLSEMFLHWTSQQQGRVVLPKINQKALNKIPVAFPPEDEQLEIVRRIDELLSRANTVEKNFVAAKGWFDRVNQSVLAKAFRGELVPQDSNDESASELLERIKSVVVGKAKKKPAAKPKAASIKEVIIDDQRIRDEVQQLESFAIDLDAGNHDLSDSLRVSYQAEIQKAQELLVDAKFSVEQFRSITEFKGGYDELKALIMNLLKGIPSVSEPLLAIESWDEKSGDYLMRLVKQK